MASCLAACLRAGKVEEVLNKFCSIPNHSTIVSALAQLQVSACWLAMLQETACWCMKVACFLCAVLHARHQIVTVVQCTCKYHSIDWCFEPPLATCLLCSRRLKLVCIVFKISVCVQKRIILFSMLSVWLELCVSTHLHVSC